MSWPAWKPRTSWPLPSAPAGPTGAEVRPSADRVGEGAPREAPVPLDTVWATAVVLITALWVASALTDGDVSPVDTTGLGAAAAAGAAALVGAGWVLRSIDSVWLAAATLILLPLAVAAAAGGSAHVLIVVLVAVAVTDLAAGVARPQALGGDRPAPWQAGVVLVGAGLLLAAVLAGDSPEGRWALPSQGRGAAATALVAGALLLLAGAVGPPRYRAVAVPGLLTGLVAGPALPDAALAVVGGGLAVIAALVVRRPGLALGFLALAAAGLSVTHPAAALLSAGSILALAPISDHPGTALLGLPGVTALVVAVIGAGAQAAPLVLAVATLATAAVLVSPLPVAGRSTLALGEVGLAGLGWGAVAVGLLAGWLVLAPSTWGWTGVTDLDHYDKGAAAAAAAGLLVLVLLVSTAENREPA